MEWLSAAFGFSERVAMRHTNADGSVSRAQMTVGDLGITVGEPSVHGDSPRRGVSSMLYVYVDDVDGHFERATAHGAVVVMGLGIRPWGDGCTRCAIPRGTSGRLPNTCAMWS